MLLREGDTLTCPVFPTVAAPVATVFRNVVSEERPRRRGAHRLLGR